MISEAEEAKAVLNNREYDDGPQARRLARSLLMVMRLARSVLMVMRLAMMMVG